jgi:hypothetical protein
MTKYTTTGAENKKIIPRCTETLTNYNAQHPLDQKIPFCATGQGLSLSQYYSYTYVPNQTV